MATKAKAKKSTVTKKTARNKSTAANSKKSIKKPQPVKTKKAAIKSKKPANSAKNKTPNKIKTKPIKKMKKITSPQKPKIVKNTVKTVKNDSKPLAKTESKAITKKTKESVSVSPLAVYKPKKNEEYMSHEQQEYFRQKLLWWQEQIFKDQGSTVTHLKGEALNFPDLIDRASMVEGYNLELKARDRERKFLKKIEESLERLENGEYGYCDDCGSEIGLERLEARPTANQCIDCKTIDEIKEKQAGAV